MKRSWKVIRRAVFLGSGLTPKVQAPSLSRGKAAHELVGDVGAMTTRTHLSRRPIARLTASRPLRREPFFKPGGLWYEVDGDWQRWMRAEDWGYHDYRYLYKLTINGARVRTIPSVHALDAFHEQYRTRAFPGSLRSHINWPKVMRDYDGIEIAPYLWERRLRGDASAWYYSWDCASGALWCPRESRLTLVTDSWRLDVHKVASDCSPSTTT